MVTNRFYYVALALVAVVFGYLTYEILKPFLSAIAWAVVFSVVFYPIFAFFSKYLKYKSFASALTVLVIVLAILGPFSYLSYLLTQEVKSLVQHLSAGESDPLKTLMQQPVLSSLVSRLLDLLDMTEAELRKNLMDGLSKLGKESIGIIGSGLGNVASVVFDFVLMLISVFFFLSDGAGYLEKAGTFLPFSKEQRNKLLVQTKEIVVSTIYGGVTVALVQGIIGGIAFAALGIHSPVMWGMAMFIGSFIPVVGTFIVWGPAAGYLFLQGALAKGIVLIAVGAIGISSVDNILRPLIVRGKMKMPTLVIFLSILGGLKVFGFIGFIMGPLVVALFVSIAEMMRHIDEPEGNRQ